MSLAQQVNGVVPSTGYIRWRLLDAALSEVGEVHPTRPGISIDNDTTRKIKRSVRGLRFPPTQAIDEFADRIGPVWVSDDEYPLGVFLYADVNRVKLPDGEAIDATLVDQCIILDQPLLDGISFPSGYNLGTALTDIAAVYQIPNPDIASTGLTSSAPLAWALGRDTGLDAMIDICQMAAFYDPYFNNEGRLVIEASTDPSALDADFFYPGTTTKRESIVESTNVLQAFNTYLAIDTGSSASPIVGRYNVPGDQPHSVANRGFPVVTTVDLQGITSTAAANDVAKAEALSNVGSFEPVTLSTIPDPRHDTYNIIDYAGAFHLETSWTLDCDPGGEMTHDLRAIYDSTS